MEEEEEDSVVMQGISTAVVAVVGTTIGSSFVMN